METYEDVIHGTISLPSYVSVIIKHSLFQRLKSIRQLGFLKLENKWSDDEIVHNRFKHSIGTYYLTSKFLNILEKNTNGLKIPKIYRLCIELAALLHDVGHGPFSHSWEYVDEFYDHERVSGKIIDIIFEDVQFNELYELKKDNNYGIELIKALITGRRDDFKLDLPQEYAFIFEIVSNSVNQIDVDKWDYLKRDSYFVSKYCLTTVDFEDFFYKARVASNGSHIEYNSADIPKIFRFFRTRWLFYVHCYYLPSSLIFNRIFHEIIRKTEFYAQYKNTGQYNTQEKVNKNFHEEFIDRNCYAKLQGHELSDLLLDESVNLIKVSSQEILNKLNSTNYKNYSALTIKIPSVLEYFPQHNLHTYSNDNQSDNIIDDTYSITKHIQYICNVNDLTIYYSCTCDYIS